MWITSCLLATRNIIALILVTLSHRSLVSMVCWFNRQSKSILFWIVAGGNSFSPTVIKCIAYCSERSVTVLLPLLSPLWLQSKLNCLLKSFGLNAHQDKKLLAIDLLWAGWFLILKKMADSLVYSNIKLGYFNENFEEVLGWWFFKTNNVLSLERAVEPNNAFKITLFKSNIVHCKIIFETFCMLNAHTVLKCTYQILVQFQFALLLCSLSKENF